MELQSISITVAELVSDVLEKVRKALNGGLCRHLEGKPCSASMSAKKEGRTVKKKRIISSVSTNFTYV